MGLRSTPEASERNCYDCAACSRQLPVATEQLGCDWCTEELFTYFTLNSHMGAGGGAGTKRECLHEIIMLKTWYGRI